MSTVQQLAAKLTQDATDSLARIVKATPADKQEWKPLDEGRTVLSQLQECATAPVFFAKILRDRAVPPMEEGAFERALAELDTVEKALAALDVNTADLLGVMGAFPDEQLAATIVMPWGGGMPMTFEQLLFMTYWNVVYHYGQIAYIQTLYGDREMH